MKPLQTQGLFYFLPRCKHGARKEIVSNGCILYASAKRVNLFGGTTTVESRPGKGTKVTIHIKASQIPS